MLSLSLVYIFIFNYIPMFGVIISFQDFNPARGFLKSEWVGWYNFEMVFTSSKIGQVFLNTVILSVTKMFFNYTIPILFAILLDEVFHVRYKRSIQTMVYLPNFLSWVILGFTFKQMFGYNGLVNNIITLFTDKPILFFEDNTWFRIMVIATDAWKDFGAGAIIYIAALTNVNPNLFEAAEMDGASRFQRIIHVSLPALKPLMLLNLTLSLGGVLNSDFGQIFNLYNPTVYESADVLATYVYRMGLVGGEMGYSAAVGLLNSVISLVLVLTSWWLAQKYSDYRIF
ncbi:MAG: sugar ABC transporter permease [Clostridiales bacterium]|nr:sugar ABC transporter permease [Clostridiales bacterium]